MIVLPAPRTFHTQPAAVNLNHQLIKIESKLIKINSILN